MKTQKKIANEKAQLYLSEILFHKIAMKKKRFEQENK